MLQAVRHSLFTLQAKPLGFEPEWPLRVEADISVERRKEQHVSWLWCSPRENSNVRQHCPCCRLHIVLLDGNSGWDSWHCTPNREHCTQNKEQLSGAKPSLHHQNSPLPRCCRFSFGGADCSEGSSKASPVSCGIAEIPQVPFCQDFKL